ncbi:MAG: helix-turn-helix domain-containing protein [Candidatus Xenobiia bacterium LiM19]|jgi:transcriptional regulator with XRE-family HTH domain
MSENPVRSIRKAAGLTIHAFANLLQCSVPNLQQIERGALHSSPRIFKALNDLGYLNIADSYEAWRKEQAERSRSLLLARKGE